MLSSEYAPLLAPGIAEYVNKCVQFMPETSKSGEWPDVEEQREIYNKTCAAFEYETPADMKITDSSVPTQVSEVPIRVYEPGISSDTKAPRMLGNMPCVVYFHGGGWVVGNLDTHQSVCIDIASACNAVVIAVDYRLAPEHEFPAAFNDAFWVTRYVYENPGTFGINPKKIVACGDSAGANLSAAVCHNARETRSVKLKGQALIYPGLADRLSLPAHSEHANAPLLTRADCEYYYRMYFGNEYTSNPLGAPLSSDNFEKLPSTFMVTAEFDPLRDDGRYYAAELTRAGVNVIYLEARGMVHGFLRARGMSEAAKHTFKQITWGINTLMAA